MSVFSQFGLFANDTVFLRGLANTINHRARPTFEWHSVSWERIWGCTWAHPPSAEPLISSKAARFRAWHCTPFFQPENTCLLPSERLSKDVRARHPLPLFTIWGPRRRSPAVIPRLFSEAPSCPLRSSRPLCTVNFQRSIYLSNAFALKDVLFNLFGRIFHRNSGSALSLLKRA